jgi:hypothetical protein
VNLTVWFEPIHTLSTLDLAPLKLDWQNELPKIEEKGPYAPWGPHDSISIISDKWPMPACIFATPEREKQVLIQNDRFSLTWYFNGESPYPGFSALFDDFSSKYDRFEQALRDSENPDPHVLRATIEYENYLAGFDSNIVSSAVVDGRPIALKDRIESSPGATAIRKHFCADEDNHQVTLMVGVDSTEPIDSTDDEEVAAAVLLTISGQAEVDKDNYPLTRMQDSHYAVIRTFLSLFDESLKQAWGQA